MKKWALILVMPLTLLFIAWQAYTLNNSSRTPIESVIPVFTQSVTTQVATITPLPTRILPPTIELTRNPSLPNHLENAACFSTQNGLACLDDLGWHNYLKGEITWRIEYCPDGELWVETLEGIKVLDGYNFKWKSFYGKPSNLISAILCIKHNDVWVSHHGGVSHYDGDSWRTFSEGDFGSNFFLDPLSGQVNGLTIDETGKIWIASSTSLAAFDGKNWIVYEIATKIENWMLYYDEIFAITSYHDKIWIDSRKGIYVFDGVQLEGFDPVPDWQTPLLGLFAQNNTYWLTDLYASGLMKLSNDKHELFSVANSPISNDGISSLAMDSQGRLWIGTEWGLNIYDGENWTVYHVFSSELPANGINDLIVIGNGPPLPHPVLEEYGILRGRIFWEGEPYKNSLLTIRPANSPINEQYLLRSFPFEVKTDDEGYFEVELPAGSYVIDAIETSSVIVRKAEIESGKTNDWGEYQWIK